MIRDILTPDARVVVQGITGKQGSFHTQAMIDAGTTIIGGTSPGKSGETVHGVPVYASLADIPGRIDISVIFVPAPYAKSAILEAITRNIPLIICITEGIPVHDMLYINQHLTGKGVTLLGPNCPGILLPEKARFGIIPHTITHSGPAAIVSRSGTLTYEAMSLLHDRGIGQKYVVGIGGDSVKGSSFIDWLQVFESDDDIETIVMIGEIGGTEEIEAADYIQRHVSKPVYGYIAGHHAPPGVQLGHAGAILGSIHESASEKTTYLSRSGITTASSIVSLIDLMVQRVK